MGGRHTPGPLQVTEGYEVWDTRADGEPGIPLVKADLGLNRRRGRDIRGTEIVANLTLFAAAPDLLEALQEARAALHQHYVDWDGEPEDAVPLQLARAKCDAAIAKATGK